MKHITYINSEGEKTPATYSQIINSFITAVASGQVLQAVKDFKNKTNTGLREAKDFIDSIRIIDRYGEWADYLPKQHILSNMNIRKELIPVIEEDFDDPVEEFIYG